MDKIKRIQQKIGVMKKDTQGYNYKYFDINQLLEKLTPLLHEEGLTLIQPLTYIGERPAIATKIYDGDKLLIEGMIPMPDLIKPQDMGSAITYYRRYSLQSLLALEAEDDDGNSASKDKKPDTSFARQRAEKDIRSSNNIQVLDEVLEKIQKSKILTSKDKEELGFLANERREEFDPTLN